MSNSSIPLKPPVSIFYRFEEFVLDAQDKKLFHRKHGYIHLEGKEFEILFLLVADAEKTLSTEQILSILWSDVIVESSNVNVRISNLRHKLGKKNRDKFIKTEFGANKGYRFVAKVTHLSLAEFEDFLNPKKKSIADSATVHNEVVESNPNLIIKVNTLENIESGLVKSSQSSIKEPIKEDFWISVIAALTSLFFFYFGIRFQNFGEKSTLFLIFVILTTCFYGVLVGLGLILEVAYQFDKYGWRASKLALFIVAVSSGAIFCALSLANFFLPHSLGRAIGIGVVFLVIGAILVCTMAKIVLPDTPITVASFQTQPAFAAFCKNVFLYFFPLYAIFNLGISCLIQSSVSLTKNLLFPVAFAIIWIFLFAFSYISTNYLSDNLLREKDGVIYHHHGLFASLLIFRAIFCFLPSLGCVIWYFVVCLQ